MKAKRLKRRKVKISDEELLNYRNFGDLSEDSCTNDLYKRRKMDFLKKTKNKKVKQPKIKTIKLTPEEIENYISNIKKA